MGFWGDEMPNDFCREVWLSGCQILCTPWAIPATNSLLSVSNQDAVQKPSFPGWQRTIAGNYMLYTSQSLLGFEVMHEQLTVLPPSMKISTKGGERGEVSRQGFGQGSRWWSGSPQVFLSQHSEKAALWWLFLELSVEILQCINRLTTTVARDKGKDAQHKKKTPLVFTLFSPCVLWLGLYLLKWAIFLWWEMTQTGGSSKKVGKPSLRVLHLTEQLQTEWKKMSLLGWASLVIIYENYSCLAAYNLWMLTYQKSPRFSLRMKDTEVL